MDTLIGGRRPAIQKKILLHRSINSFFSYYSSITLSDLPVNKKFKILYGIHQKLVEIELNCADWMSELDKLEVHHMRIMTLSSMLSYRGVKDNLKMMGLATSLSSILLGLRRIEINSILVDKNNPEYSRRLALTFNLLDEYFVIFSSLINSLDEIYRQDFDRWIEIVIYNLFQLVQLLRMRWDVEEIYKRGGGFQNFGFVFSTYTSVIRTLVKLYTKTRKGISVVPEFASDEKFIDLIASLRDEVKDKIDEFMEANDKGLFGRNENALESMPVMNALTSFEQVKGIPELYQNLMKLTIHGDFDTEWLRAEVERLEEYFTKYLICHDDIKVLSTDYGESSIEFIEEAILVNGLLARETNSLDTLEKFRSISGKFLSDEGREYFPQLYAFYLFMRITAVDVPKGEDLRELKEVARFLRPRHRFNYTYLSAYVSLAIGMTDVEEFIHELSEEYRLMMGYVKNPVVLDSIQEYIDTTFKKSCGYLGESDFSVFSSVNPFDPFMVIYPKVTVNLPSGPVFYIPLYGIENELVGIALT